MASAFFIQRFVVDFSHQSLMDGMGRRYQGAGGDGAIVSLHPPILARLKANLSKELVKGSFQSEGNDAFVISPIRRTKLFSIPKGANHVT